MATRKQFIEVRGYWPDGGPKRNSPLGGVVVGDYFDDKTGDRVVLVKMPKVEKRAPAKKQKKVTPVAKAVQDAVDRQGQYADAGVTHGA